MMQMLTVAAIMVGSMLFCCFSSCCLQRSEDASLKEEQRIAEERARIAFEV